MARRKKLQIYASYNFLEQCLHLRILRRIKYKKCLKLCQKQESLTLGNNIKFLFRFIIWSLVGKLLFNDVLKYFSRNCKSSSRTLPASSALAIIFECYICVNIQHTPKFSNCNKSSKWHRWLIIPFIFICTILLPKPSQFFAKFFFNHKLLICVTELLSRNSP